MPDKVLADLRRRLEPLARAKPPLSVLPPRKTRFGSPLVLSRVHWVEPRLVVEITFLTGLPTIFCDTRSILASGGTNRRPTSAGRPRVHSKLKAGSYF
jgi:hypothetical protein